MKNKSIRTDQTGAAAVEFAIVLPILLLLVFGIIEFSAVMYDQAMITNASREGARAGIVFRPDRAILTHDEIEAVIAGYLQNNLLNFGGTSTPTVTTGYVVLGASEDYLTVNVSYPYNFLILPSFVSSLGGGLTLTAQTTMRMEDQGAI